jgi:hypothetical protein
MNPNNQPLTEELEPVASSVSALQNQLNEALKQLSYERLQVVADFVAYLSNAESEAATQELLAIPGLLEQVQQNKSIPKTQYANWRTIRADV